MTTNHSTPSAEMAAQPPTDTAPAPEISVGLMDAMNWAGGVINAAINIEIDGLLPPGPRLLWDTASPLLACGRWDLEARVAYVLMLDALTASPRATQALLKGLRDHLVAKDPALEFAQRATG